MRENMAGELDKHYTIVMAMKPIMFKPLKPLIAFMKMVFFHRAIFHCCDLYMLPALVVKTCLNTILSKYQHN